MNWSGKTILITGASSGLGKALAKEFHKRGSSLALLDVDLAGLEQLRNELGGDAQKISIHQCDISDEAQVVKAKENIMREFSALDVVINNAGISISQYFDLMELKDYRRLMDVNFWGTVNCTKHFLPGLKKQNEARLVNIISDFALMGFPGKTAYASSKSAVMGFTNSLKTELAKSNVKVSLVIPPPLNTAIVQKGLHMSEDKRRNEMKFLEEKGMPLDKAARKMVQQIGKGKFRIVVGRMMYFIDLAARLFPSALHKRIGRRAKKFDFL